ncbi:MAG: DUF4349 domain-containing protein [Anaerolineae bacterium]|nr:MAG: DUF4349 domain-containing protein [Anaerolineae bacterium]
MKEIELFGVNVKTKYLWWGGGLLILVPLLLILLLAMLGALAGGASFSEGAYGGGGDYGYPASAPSADYTYPTDSSGVYAEEAPYAPLATQVAPVGNATDGSLTQAIERLIIREGTLSLQVEDTLAARDQVEVLVSEFELQGAFIVSSNEYGNGTTKPSISMVIRVPASQFDPIMDRLAALAVIVNTRYETADDVTEEYVDLEGRLEALETGRDRLLDIMENADTTEALLQAEAQLTIREAEIEAIQGRLQYLRGAATLSRITLDMQPYFASQPIDTSWKPFESLRRGFDALLESLQDFVDFVLFFAVAVLPWVLLFFFVLRWIWRAIRRRQQKAAAAAPPEEKK